MVETSPEGGESVPLQNLNSPETTSTETEEPRENAPFIQQRINVPLVYARIRMLVHTVLDFIPLPQGPRAYLKERWFTVFVSTVVILLIAILAVIALVVLFLRPMHTPASLPDPFPNWAKGLGPDDRSSLRLPGSLKPVQYRLHIYLHMNEVLERFHYQGRLALMVEAESPFDMVDNFLIHAHKYLDIDYDNFVITDDTSFAEEMADVWESFPYIDEDGALQAGDDGDKRNSQRAPFFGHYEVPNVTRLDDDTLEVKVRRPIAGETMKIILIRFNGTMRQNPPGIFVNKIMDTDDYWLATQFQPSLARAVFPCFDEPSLKSQFYLSIAHPTKYVALSNMPKIQGREVSERLGKAVDTIWTTFKPSIRMSTYLFGFVVGPFKSHQLKQQKNMPDTELFALNHRDFSNVSIFAANLAAETLAFAEKYFKTEFPLLKLQMVALPSEQPINSECWGLILFREDAIFIDLATTSVDMLENVARNVIHYIIHQWVGNLVGPAWWNDLWATEALIRHLEDVFIQKLFPEWHVDEYFGTQVIAEALNTDVLDQAHAVSALPRIPYYPMTMFDALTSVKGAALFRMMEIYSPGSVQATMQEYLKMRNGQSVTTNILFQDLHYAVYSPTGNPENGPPILVVMKKWTLEPGYPLVTIIRYDDSPDISLFQETFNPVEMISRESLKTHEIPSSKCRGPGKHATASEETPAWFLPIELWVRNDTGLLRTDAFWQTTAYHRVCGENLPRGHYIIANYNQTGFFRVNYDESNWQMIGHEMMHDPKIHSTITRAQLIDDAMAMAKVGRLNFVKAMEMPLALLYQGADDNELTEGDVGMFERAMRAVADVHDCLRGSQFESDMLEYMRLLAGAQWAAVDPPKRKKLEEEDVNSTDVIGRRTSMLLQEQAIFWGCYTGMKECTDFSIALIQEWTDSHQSQDAYTVKEYLSNAYCAAVRYGPDSFFYFLWGRFNKADLSEVHKQEILWALLCTPDQKKMMHVIGGFPGERALFDDTVKLWMRMSGRNIAAWYAFKFERANWNNMHHTLFGSSFFSQLIVAITSALSTPADLEEIQRFQMEHNETLWEVQELLEENVHNIRKRLHFRGIIEDSIHIALKEILPIANAVKIITDGQRYKKMIPTSPIPPAFSYAETKHEAVTPHPF